MVSVWYMVHFMIFNNYKVCRIITPHRRESVKIMSQVFELYINLPDFMNPDIIKYSENRHCLELCNQSSIGCITYSENVMRGYAVNMVIIQDSSLMDKLLGNLWPTVSSGKHSRLCVYSREESYNKYPDEIKQLEVR